MKLTRPVLPYLLASFGLIFSLSATAQYMWLDAAGGKVFSDVAPPSNIPAKRILKQPSNTASTTTATTVATPETVTADTEKTNATVVTTATKTSETKPAVVKDKGLEAAKKKIDDQAAAKKKAEQDKIDLAKADNCVRAKQAKATFESGMRIGHTNAKGERGFMDDSTRMVETKRLEGIIAADCK